MYRNKTLLWKRESVTIKKFLDQYRNKLPVIVKISEENQHWKNISAIFRVQKCEKQPRVLARAEDGRLLSLPIETPDKYFYIPHGGKTSGKTSRSLFDIIGKEVLPFSIVQDGNVSLIFHDGTDVRYGDNCKLGVLRVEKIYAEDMLLGNIITDGVMCPAVMVIPALLYLSFHEVIDLADGDKQEWNQMITQYNDIAKKVSYKTTLLDVYVKPPDREAPETAPKTPTRVPEEPKSPTPLMAAISEPPSLPQERGRNRIFLGNIQSIASIISVIGDNVNSSCEDIETRYLQRLREESLKKPEVEAKEEVEVSLVKDDEEEGYKCLTDVPRNLSGLTVLDVADCLCLLHLGHLAQAFVDKQIDGSLLKTVNMEDIKKELDLSDADATKLEKFIHDEWRPSLIRPQTTFRNTLHQDNTKL